MDKLYDDRRRDALRLLAIEHYHKHPAPVVLDDKRDFYSWIVDHLGAETELSYLEFGVGHGESLKFFLAEFSNKRTSFFGFDSFEGLPTAWQHLPQFTFGQSGIVPSMGDSRLQFVKGWFQNTIPAFFAEWQKPSVPILVHYDADLYSSTSFALAVTWHHIPEYYFLMDDFLSDDAIALFDFSAAFPIEIEFLAQAGRDGNGKALPSWVAGRIRPRVFEPRV